MAKVAVAGIIVFPIGVFTSSMISLSAALCSKDSSWRWDWYCRNAGDDTQTFFFRLITAWVPSLLLATWNSIVVPFGFAFLALFEGTESTLNGIDRKVFRWFYLYSCINVVLGGMLAGTLFSQLENIIKSPSSVFVLLGHAVPQSSGFFLAYISTNAFMLEPIRLIFPHSGVATYVLSGCGKKTKLCGRVERDRTDCWAPKSNASRVALRKSTAHSAHRFALFLSVAVGDRARPSCTSSSGLSSGGIRSCTFSFDHTSRVLSCSLLSSRA